MAKSKCKAYYDVVSALNDQDTSQNQTTTLNSTIPHKSWLNKIFGSLSKMFASKASPLNDTDIRKSIKDAYGKVTDRDVLSVKIIALIEANPGIEDMINHFIFQQTTVMEGRGEVAWDPDTKDLMLETLPINVLKNIYNEASAIVKYGTGQNLGKSWLRGILGPLELQLTIARKIVRREYTSSMFRLRKAVKDFPNVQAYVLERFSGKDHEKKDRVTIGKKKKIRDFGYDDIVKSLYNIAMDPSLSKLKLVNARRIIHDMFVWHNATDDFGHSRLKIDKDGNMTIAQSHESALDEDGNVQFWDGDQTTDPSPKKVFGDYVSVEEHYGDHHVPFEPNMLRAFKEESVRYQELHKNVWEYLNKESKKSEKALYKQLRGLVPKGWKDEDITKLFFQKDPTKFVRRIYKKDGSLDRVVSWSDLTAKQQNLISLIHNNATRYNILKPFVFNGKNEQDGQEDSKGRKSFPIIYNQMHFSYMWDTMIDNISEELDVVNAELEAMEGAQSAEDKQIRSRLIQRKKLLTKKKERAKKIRDTKDDYPVDMANGMYMPLGEDVKHVKHITNGFDIFAADTGPGTYIKYLQHNISSIERNKLTIELIKNLQTAESAPAQEWMINHFKVATYQPDAASGLSWINFDSESISSAFKKIGFNISPAKIDRKTRKVLAYISGNLLRGQSTAIQNYTAVIQKYIDVGMARVSEAYEIMGQEDPDVKTLVGLSGVVDFKEFFSKSLVNDANNLGGDNKKAIEMGEAMIRYWKKAKGKDQATKKKLQEELQEELGMVIKSIPELSRLKKRLAVHKDMHTANILRKWTNYAINKEYEAAPYIKNVTLKKGMRAAEIWAQFARTHLPTMGRTEQDLRALSFIIGVRAAMRKGWVPDKAFNKLKPKERALAIEAGVDYVEQMDFGMSRQDIGQMGQSNVGAFFTQFKTWSMQKFAKDLDTVRLAYQELKDVDNEFLDFKAGAQMFESLIRLNKYDSEHLSTTSPRLAAFRRWIFTQGLWTAIWDFGIMGPLTLIPGMRGIYRTIPGIRTVGGSTSDLISLMLLVPGLAIAASNGDGEDDMERIFDYYSRKTFFGFGARWTWDAFLAMLATIESEDDEEYYNSINKVVSPALPPPLRELKALKHLPYLVDQAFD